MKKTAFGVLALKHDEFWCMTPREFGELVEGFRDRHEYDMQKIAWQTANLMNVHIQKKRDMVTVEKLLGKKKEQNKQMSELEIKQRMAELQKKLKEEGEHGGSNRIGR